MADAYNEILLPIENITCQNLLEEQCTHCGWLRKRRTLNFFSWPQAYVVIHNGCVYYFRNEAAKKAAGKFSLYGYNAVYRASEILSKDAPWCFKIVHTHMDFKTYYFAAASEQEMKVWMSKIKIELLKANGGSDLYGRNLPHVKEEKHDKIEDDPKFYEKIEANIYEDSSKFIPAKDYEKKCSIKKQNEDSDDEEIEINEAINSRPPAPLPPQEPFLTLKTSGVFNIDDPLGIPTFKSPMKPPRVESPARVEPPAREPPTRIEPPRRIELSREKDAPPATPPRTKKEQNKKLTKIQQMALQIDDTLSTRTKSPKQKRRGSYVKTDVFDDLSPVGNNHMESGGSTGDDDVHSDADEYLADFYFDCKDSKKASDIIMGIGEEGVYLVRPESQGDRKVLVVYYDGQTKKYKIQQQHGEYFLAKEGHHCQHLDLLLKHYHENYLPTITALLTKPYKLHPAYKQ